MEASSEAEADVSRAEGSSVEADEGVLGGEGDQMSQDDDSEPVTVFRTNDPGLLAVAQSLLEDADIQFFVAGQAVSGLYPGGVTGPYGVPEIRVAAQIADEARDLLKGLG